MVAILAKAKINTKMIMEILLALGEWWKDWTIVYKVLVYTYKKIQSIDKNVMKLYLKKWHQHRMFIKYTQNTLKK